MIAKADIRRVQEWMGHVDIQTTMRYLHYAPREEDARLVAEAFARGPCVEDDAHHPRSRSPRSAGDVLGRLPPPAPCAYSLGLCLWGQWGV
jgi:hypothetical protein